MSKLKLFRIIGESLASALGKNSVAYEFFDTMAKEMYPKNLHRREWAVANMRLFYDQECERIIIMNRLTGKTTGQNFIDSIRKRQEEDEWS